ncbi:hypothetical protein COV82_05160, partial [Candidatus Peregrinibacteria bacterium CG11_big_fil_rev_8_21_14_0_20_46_8]
WELMLKAIALYRDGSKLSQALNTGSLVSNYTELFNFEEDESDESVTPERVNEAIAQEMRKPLRRKLPAERLSITHKFVVGNHEGYLTVGLYEDGSPGEIFIKISKEGSTLSGIMDALALTISLGLQYGVPLEVMVGKFCHSRFEPSGMTNNKHIPIVKSIMDYIGRYFALKFLPKETAKKYHNEELIDRAYAEGNPTHLKELPSEAPAYQTSSVDHHLGARDHGSIKHHQAQVAIPKPVTAGNTTAMATAMAGQAGQATSAEEFAKQQTILAMSLNNEDAPMCNTCGMIMVRNGACHKCNGCGATSGCS